MNKTTNQTQLLKVGSLCPHCKKHGLTTADERNLSCQLCGYYWERPQSTPPVMPIAKKKQSTDFTRINDTEYRIELQGTKADKASSRGFCTRQKSLPQNGYGQDYNYQTERSIALASGTLSTFEHILIGSLGLDTDIICGIVDIVNRTFTTVYFKWGNSNRVLEVKRLGNGASKKAYHFREAGNPYSKGFVLKYNYDKFFQQTRLEMVAYEKAIEKGVHHMVAKIYKSSVLTKTENNIPVRYIKGVNRSDIINDGYICCEYCNVGAVDFDALDDIQRDNFRNYFNDIKGDNMGLDSNGKPVMVDYGLQGAKIFR